MIITPCYNFLQKRLEFPKQESYLWGIGLPDKKCGCLPYLWGVKIEGSVTLRVFSLRLSTVGAFKVLSRVLSWYKVVPLDIPIRVEKNSLTHPQSLILVPLWRFFPEFQCSTLILLGGRPICFEWLLTNWILTSLPSQSFNSREQLTKSKN